MAYTKTSWIDRSVQYPSNFTSVTNADGTITLTPSPGTITNAGTPLTASALNNLETQYDDAVAYIQGLAQMFKLTLDSGLSKNAVDSSSNPITDFNNLQTPGEYYFGAGLTTNGPIAASADAGVIIVRSSSANIITQQVIYTGGNQKFGYMYSRSSFQGVWGTWDKFTQVSTDFFRSLSVSGYQKLPNGLIFQWGKAASVPSGTTTNVNLPIAFPNAIFAVIPGLISASGSTGYVPVTGSLSQIGLLQTQGSARDMHFWAIGW